MLRHASAAVLLTLAITPGLAAQRPHPTQAQLRAEVRRVLVNLRDAAEHRDWTYMIPAFPTEGPLTERVRAVVTGGPGSGGLSFWTPTAAPDFDELTLAPIKEDLVAISLPFVDAGNPGSFGAVFERQAGEWRLTCFLEAFPAKPMQPGCVPDGPASQ